MEETALRRFRILFILLIIWDLAIGVYALFFAGSVQQLVKFVPQSEPLFVRGVGEYWIFASYFQYLGYKDPQKNMVAIHLSVVYRLMAGVVDFVVAFFLLPTPIYFFHYVLVFFGIMDCLIAYLTVHYTKKMGLDCLRI